MKRGGGLHPARPDCWLPTERPRGQNQKWPTCGQSSYFTCGVSGIPVASELEAKSEVAHLWAKWPRHPCCLGDPHCFRAGGQNQKGPTCGQRGYVTPAVSGIPTASERRQNQTWPTCGQIGYVTPAVPGIPNASERRAKSDVAHLSAKWLCHLYRFGDPHRFRAGGKIRSCPLVGKVATSLLPFSGIPTASERGEKIRGGPVGGKVAT